MGSSFSLLIIMGSTLVLLAVSKISLQSKIYSFKHRPQGHTEKVLMSANVSVTCYDEFKYVDCLFTCRATLGHVTSSKTIKKNSNISTVLN